MPPGIPPTHVIDLMTTTGAAALGAQWKVSDVKIVEVPAIQGAMPQYKTTYSIEPQAGGSDFDDSKWPNIEPKDLAARRSGGHVAFMWYRTPLTIPAKIGDFDPSGAMVVLTVTVDDYAEVWVNGAIPGRSGYPAPPRSRATTCQTAWCSALVSRQAISSRSQCSASTDQFQWHRRIRSGSAKQRWSFTSKGPQGVVGSTQLPPVGCVGPVDRWCSLCLGML